jgi:ankyrin repeat protein
MGTVRQLTLCLAAGMDKNMIVSCYGETRLHKAASKPDNPEEQKIFRLLLSEGAHVHAIDFFGGTPLFHLVHYYSRPSAEVDITFRNTFTMLVEHGADINVTYGHCGPPLLMAAIDCDLEVVRMLLEHGADPNKMKNSVGWCIAGNRAPSTSVVCPVV